MFGWLKHDATTGGERGAEFPRGHQQREIPRDDLANDADGFAGGVGVIAALARESHGNRVAFNLGSPAGVVAEVIDGKRKVRDTGDLERLAVVERFELRKFFGVLFDQIGEAPHHAAAFGGRNFRPGAFFECCAGRFYGAVDIFAIAFGDMRENFSGGGIVGGESFAGSGFDPLAVDEHLLLLAYE